jgi:hypothetical protein
MALAMKRIGYIVGAIIALLGLLYSLTGIAMAIWVSALPNVSLERVRLDFRVWVSATAVCSVLLATFTVLMFRDRRRHSGSQGFPIHQKQSCDTSAH